MYLGIVRGQGNTLETPVKFEVFDVLRIPKVNLEAVASLMWGGTIRASLEAVQSSGNYTLEKNAQ